MISSGLSIKSIKEHFLQARFMYLAVFLAFIGVYIFWIVNYTPGIDTEITIDYPTPPFNWKFLGRWGLLLTLKIFNVEWFNPIFCTVFGFFLFFLSALILGYVFYEITKKHWIGPVFGIVSLISPMLTTQIYFRNQILPIGFAYCLLGIALYAGSRALSGKFISKRNRIIALVVFFGSLVWTLASYQSFNYVYIGMVVFVFILTYISREFGKDNEGKVNYGLLILFHVVIFVIAFLINQLITKIVCNVDGGYFTDGILWKQEPREIIFNNIKTHIFEAFFGDGIGMSLFYGIFAIGSFVVLIVLVIAKRTRLWGMFIGVMVLLNITPFLLTFIQGSMPAYRTQMAYPLIFAANVCLLGICMNYKILKVGFGILLAFTLIHTGQITARLVYTDAIRGESDKAIARSIFEDMRGMNPENKPYYIVGSVSKQSNNAMLNYGMIGVSFFEWDKQLDPKYFYSTKRIVEFARTLGYECKETKVKNGVEAREAARELSSWPNEGCYLDMGDYVILKIGEDEWPETIGIEKYEWDDE